MLILLIALMVFFTSLQIICRVFFNALSWSEEITRYLLVYSTFFGAASVYKKNGHISVLVVQQLLPPRFQKYAIVFVNLLCTALFGVAVFYGFRYMSLQGNQLSAALRIPMKYLYMSIPVGFSFMIVHSIDNIFTIFQGEGGAK
jgi:TRAP-type C4-dicarboxylate transport system permease small subunit